MPLPVPVGRQKEVLYLPAKGHTVVLGTAGSGKTTLAVLRAAYLAAADTDHGGRTLLVTFNRALVAYLRHLQDRRLANVTVENYHRFARGYLAFRNKMRSNAICSDHDQRRAFIAQAVKKVAVRYNPHPIFDSGLDMFSEEFRWMAQHGIARAVDYENAERIGRSKVRIDRRLRAIVFEVYQEYKTIRISSGKLYDWDDLASGVADEFATDPTPRLYRHIVIDEGQDFSPEMLRSLANAVPADGSLTFFGDMAQQIYGHRMSWKSAGLRVAKVWEFKENYRNTRQIARLGLAISRMPYFRDVPDLVEPIAPSADGPLPTLVSCASLAAEIELVIGQAIAASRTQTVALLMRSREDEQLIRPRLPKSAIRLDHDMTTWRAEPGIRYGTYHASKGLEFDVVILPFFTKDRLPDSENVRVLGDDDANSLDGRLVYVAVTRAKTRLIITHSGMPTDLLPTAPALYERLQR
jgi:superfamily I DNA/RNA helicase